MKEIAIIIQNNNIHKETNNPEYANLNINQNELNIFYLDVGQGDSTFITINGCNMLIDSGNDQDGYYISLISSNVSCGNFDNL